MFEKVNPAHPDKLADRIAGAIVDLVYYDQEGMLPFEIVPRIAVEVLVGHNSGSIIIETTSDSLKEKDVKDVLKRILGTDKNIKISINSQDPILSDSQEKALRCGDNGIFLGVPISSEEKYLSNLAHKIYSKYPYDGKYIYDEKTDTAIICQSNISNNASIKQLVNCSNIIINPLGPWVGGTNVDTGATNRKLGSDMGAAITGGGLHGKDLTKSDISVNIYVYLLAQEKNRPIEAYCSIGSEEVFCDGKYIKFKDIVKTAYDYIKSLGGFETFAEWGLV